MNSAGLKKIPGNFQDKDKDIGQKDIAPLAEK